MLFTNVLVVTNIVKLKHNILFNIRTSSKSLVLNIIGIPKHV